MRWFKMMSDNLDDPFIQDLICEFGGDGYLVFFGILSLIARENKKIVTGKAEFSARYLKQKLHISPTKVRLLLDFCQTKGKLFYTFSHEKFNFYFPKMLDIKDDYSRKSGHAQDKVPLHTEVEVDLEVDKETHTEKPKGEVCVLVEFFKAEFSRVHGVEPPESSSHLARRIYTGLLKSYTLDDLQWVTTAFLECHDPPLVKAGYPVGWLPHRAAWLLLKKPRSPEPLPKVEIPSPTGVEAQAWAQVREKIEPGILPGNFEKLILPLRPAYVNCQNVVLVAPDRRTKDGVELNYLSWIETLFSEGKPSPVRVQIIAEEQVET